MNTIIETILGLIAMAFIISVIFLILLGVGYLYNESKNKFTKEQVDWLLALSTIEDLPSIPFNF